MAKLLRVLTVILLLLSIGTLVLGSLLFAKRELLKGRTQKLENSMIELAAFLEAADSEPRENTFTAKDESEVRADLDSEIDYSDFWASYKAHLEDPEQPLLSIRRDDLMRFYKRDPITLKVEKDAMGYPVTTGKGTMDATLRNILASADLQLTRLNDTRLQLQGVRQELVTTIEELNSRKGTLREKLVHINDLNGTISQLEGKVARLEDDIENLTEEKRELEDEVAAQQVTITDLNEQVTLRDETIEDQRTEIEKLRLALQREGPRITGEAPMVTKFFEPGEKGRVVAVNKDWNYIILGMNDSFMREMEKFQTAMSKETAPGVPAIEFFVKRGRNFKTFVSKIKLVQIKKREKLAIADVMVEWQQLPLAKGDVVFY